MQTTTSYLTNEKKTELKRLQTSNLELKFEVKVKIQGLNPQPVFHVSKIEHKTTPAPFEVFHIDLERDPQLPDLTYGKAKSSSIIRIPDLSTQHRFRLYPFIYITHLILHTFLLPFTSPISVTSTNSDNYLSPDDPNITNLVVSHYDCQKQNNHFLPLPVTLDPLECKNMIRHLNGTDNKILNIFSYNKTFKLLEDHYIQEKLEQYQTPFTVHQLNKMYTGTFTFMPADKTWIYDTSRNPYHNCPAHHQFEVNLVSWRLEVSEIELTYDDTENVMIIDGYNLPCYFADGFCKPTTKTPFTLVWFSDDFCLIFTLQDFIGQMTTIDDGYWIETDSFVHSSHSTKPDSTSGIKSTSHPYIHAPHPQNSNNPSLSRFEIFPNA